MTQDELADLLGISDEYLATMIAEGTSGPHPDFVLGEELLLGSTTVFVLGAEKVGGNAVSICFPVAVGLGAVRTSALPEQLTRVSVHDEVVDLLLSARHWYRADTYVLSGANVASLPNKGVARGELVVSGTLAAPVANPALNDQNALAFAGGQWCDSSLPPSEFKFLHDGSGFDVFIVFQQTAGNSRVLAATKTSAQMAGVQFHHGMDSYGCIVANASTMLYQLTAAARSAIGEGGLYEASYETTNEPKVFVGSQDQVIAISTAAGTPAAVDPTHTFRLGAALDGTGALAGEVADVIIFDRRLTPYERQLIRDYCRERYALPLLSPSDEARDVLRLNPASWIRADSHTLVSGKVDAWIDLARPGHKLVQATATKQCPTPVPSANWNQALTAVFNGQQTYRSNLPKDAWRFLHDGSGFGVYAPFRTSSGGVIVATHAVGPGPGIQLSWDSGDRLRLYIPFATTSSKYALGAAPVNTRLLCQMSYVEGRTPSEVVLRTDRGSYAGNSDQAPTQSAPEDTLTWASNPATAGSNANFGGEMPELLVFDRALTSVEEGAVDAYLNRRYVVAPFDETKMYGLDGFSVDSYFRTQGAGGEPGDVTGFLWAVLCVVTSQSVSSKTRPLLERLTDSPAAGYSVSTKTTNASVSTSIASDVPALVTSGAYTVPAGSVGQLMLFIGQHSGGQAHESRFFANAANVSRTPMTGYTPATSAPTLLGAGLRSGSAVAADGVVIYEAATFTGISYLSDVAAWAGQVRQTGNLSPAMNRAVQTHRWSLKEELAKGGVAIQDGAVAPASLPDIITGLPEHALQRQGSPVVRVGSPEWSYTRRRTS